MIFILSSASDLTTNTVMDWLQHFGLSIFRVNGEDSLEVNAITIPRDDITITNPNSVGSASLDFSQLTGFWYRRGQIVLLRKEKAVNSPEEGELLRYLHRDATTVSAYIDFTLSKLPHVNKQKDTAINKLIALQEAATAGLKVPYTTLSHSPQNLPSDRSYIAKAIWEGGIDFNDTVKGGYGTISVDPSHQWTKGYSLSKFQEEQSKWIELRIFYLHGECFASAIFSQKNPKTSLDFRNYDRAKPNRVVPYILPEDIQLKISKLMSQLALNCGSIDMILTPELEYVFLEVNPVGQFDQVSKPCGYYLEEKIAHYFYENDKTRG